MDLEEGIPMAVGEEAKLMLGRTPGKIKAIRPMKGIINKIYISAYGSDKFSRCYITLN